MVWIHAKDRRESNMSSVLLYGPKICLGCWGSLSRLSFESVFISLLHLVYPAFLVHFLLSGSVFIVLSEAATKGVLRKKLFLEISQNLQENTCARVSFLIKLQVSGFFLNFWEHFLQNTSGRLLLLYVFELSSSSFICLLYDRAISKLWLHPAGFLWTAVVFS